MPPSVRLPKTDSAPVALVPPGRQTAPRLVMPYTVPPFVGYWFMTMAPHPLKPSPSNVPLYWQLKTAPDATFTFAVLVGQRAAL